MVRWLDGWMAGWLDGWIAGWLFGRSVGLSVGRCCVGRSDAHVAHDVVRTMRRLRLTPLEKTDVVKT